MTTYCTVQNKTAIILLSKNGYPIQIKSNNPPVTITCKANNDYSDCTIVKVGWSYTQQDTTTNAITTVTTSTIIRAPILGLKVGTNGSTVEFNCRGFSSGGCTAQGWVQIAQANIFFRFIDARIISIEPNDGTQNPGSKGVIIKDSRDIVIFDDDNIDCTWNVVCDNDCPEGTCKCPSPIYPGYCCLDCASVATTIHAITNDLKAKNNG